MFHSFPKVWSKCMAELKSDLVTQGLYIAIFELQAIKVNFDPSYLLFILLMFVNCGTHFKTILFFAVTLFLES